MQVNATGKTNHRGNEVLRFVVVLLLIACTQVLGGQSQHWQFDRINIENVNDDTLLSKTDRTQLDSIFQMGSTDLMEFERLLGYKLTGQLHLRLFTDVQKYQVALQSHSIWTERFLSDFQGVSTNHYPVYVGTELNKIRVQLRYVIAHMTLSEFLNGSSVRQKMTQSGYHHFPTWISQGLCAFWANGWNISAHDEFQYFRDKSAFKYPNHITPLSAQVFGRFIWKQWIQAYGTSAITNFWFVVKYTGQTASAIEYLTGQDFAQWYRESKYAFGAKRSEREADEFPLTRHSANSPILNLIELHSSNTYLIQLYVPDQEYWCIESLKETHSDSRFVYKKQHAKLISEAAFYLNEMGDSENYHSEKPLKELLLNQTSIDTDPHPLDPAKINQPNANFHLIRKPFLRDQYFIQLAKNYGVNTEIIWTDTLFIGDVIKDLIIESDNLISYIQSTQNQWYVNFSKITDSLVIRWKIPLAGGYARQYQLKNDRTENGILEVSFKDNHAQFRRLESGDLSSLEIREMMRKSPTQDDTTKATNGSTTQALTIAPTIADTWVYLSPFPRKDLGKLRSSSQANLYRPGSFVRCRAKSAMILERGGLFLSNEDPLAFPMPAFLNPNKFYNHPLTPELRFYLRNPRFNHKIKLGLLSNLPLSRMAIRLEQEWKLNRWTIQQNYYHRSRDYSPTEGYMNRTLGNKFSAGLSRTYQRDLTLSIDLNIQRDESFRLINGPISGALRHETLNSNNITMRAHYGFNGNNPNKQRRYHGEIWGKTGITKYGQCIKWGSQYSRATGRLGFDFHLAAQLQKIMGGVFNFEGKVQFNSSAGDVQNEYWVGGSQGWINPTPWDISIWKSAAVDDDGYRLIGGYVRGFYSGVRLGHSSAVMNLQLGIFPFKLMFKDIIKSELLKRFEAYTLLDVGTAYVGKSLSDDSNPFNRQTYNTPNLLMDVYAKRNPWVVGTGLGVGTELLKMPIRYEVAWGLKEGKILTPIHHVCMTWNF
ncbi:MAG: hypothetical protein FJ333_01290 [Sphingomonadales bacterium]|nr:hypothetical protein [Sphingomonadales bacterium]